jgi:hypothetical protein
MTLTSSKRGRPSRRAWAVVTGVLAAAGLLAGLAPAAAARHGRGDGGAAVQLRAQRPGGQPDRVRHVR